MNEQLDLDEGIIMPSRKENHREKYNNYSDVSAKMGNGLLRSICNMISFVSQKQS